MKFGDETEQARKGDDGVCGRGRKWRSCERVRGISSVIWRRGRGERIEEESVANNLVAMIRRYDRFRGWTRGRFGLYVWIV